MNQWESDKEHFFSSLSSNMGDKIDLLGELRHRTWYSIRSARGSTS